MELEWDKGHTRTGRAQRKMIQDTHLFLFSLFVSARCLLNEYLRIEHDRTVCWAQSRLVD